MGYLKQKCSTSGKIPLVQFEELKEIFLADVAAEVLMNEISGELIINWDQTTFLIILTNDWTSFGISLAKIIPSAAAITTMVLTTPFATLRDFTYS